MLFLLVLLPMAIGQPVLAGPTVTERLNYYDVSGSSVQEIRANLNRRRPSDDTGTKYEAVTRWHLQWNYRYEPAGQQCAIRKASTSVKVVITFPRLKDNASTPAQVVEAFARYTEKLLYTKKAMRKTLSPLRERSITEFAGSAPAHPVSSCERRRTDWLAPS